MGYRSAINRCNKINFDTNKTNAYIRKIQRELFYTWCFLAREDLLDEANEFCKEYRDSPSPLEDVSFVNR